MPSITWQVKPPQDVWQPAGALAGSSGETPALGEFWYRVARRGVDAGRDTRHFAGGCTD
jgi:hypothetical protein